MLHRHVVALFYHGVLIGNIGTWADGLICARLIDIAVKALVLKASLAGVEHNSIL